jgi:hypothetical protein
VTFSKVFVVFFIIAALASIVSYAPHYLAHSDQPNKSDAIVLMVGPDYEAREKEAHDLIEESFADYLLIPAHGTILKATDDRGQRLENGMAECGNAEMPGSWNAGMTVNGRAGMESKIDRPGEEERGGEKIRKLEPVELKRLRRGKPEGYCNLYENTHLEVLWASQMMDAYGLTSSIFVSSPAHMRRIKIIADRVFDENPYRLAFVHTKYEKPWGYLWWTDRDGLKQVMSEYVKIVWFLMYAPFVER